MRTARVGQKAKMADLHEACWKNVEQEAANEFDCFNRHELLRVAIG